MCGHNVFRGSFGLPGFKGKVQVALPNVPFFPWAAMQGQKNLSHMRPNMCSRPKCPTSLWHPWRATSLCAAGRTNWKRASSDSLGPAYLYRTPCLSSRWLCSHLYWLTLGGSVALDWPFPSIPSCSLVMTKLRTASTSWALCQFCKVIQVTCWLSWTASRTCRSQL